MSKAHRIEITDNAQAHIVAASAWWHENRPVAPDAFLDELDRIFDLLRVEPAMGTLAINTRLGQAGAVGRGSARWFLRP